jgi:hypothetical protein
VTNEIIEPVNLGISEENHTWLKKFKEEGIFQEMRDAYKFSVALAIAQNIKPKEIFKKETVFGIATIDPSRELYFCIDSLYFDINQARYHLLEQLAEAGMSLLVEKYKSGKLDLVKTIEEVSRD